MLNKKGNDLLEESILLCSLLKWTILSTFIGIIVGIVTTLFIKIIKVSTNYVTQWHYYFLLLPIGLFLSSFIIIKLAPDAKGHGTEKAIKAVNENSGNMNFKVIPVKLLTTLITLISGGSVGLEGPATQIGAGLSSLISNLFKIDTIDKKKLGVCGIGSGFVCVFGAPIGAAFFACEVLFMGKFSYLALFPALISSFVSYYTGIFLGIEPLCYKINYIPKNHLALLPQIMIFGIFIGILSVLFIKLVNGIESLSRHIKLYQPLKGLIGGIIIIVLTFIIGSTNYLGIGEEIINKSLNGEFVNKLAFLYKSLTTSLTLGTGGSGGILTPMLFIGASSGNAWAAIFHLNPQFYASIGMVAFLSSCSNTPISAIIISLELFGNHIGVFCAIACVISYMLVGHRSIYPTQMVISKKSPSIAWDINCEVNDIRSLKLIKHDKILSLIENFRKKGKLRKLKKKQKDKL